MIFLYLLFGVLSGIIGGMGMGGGTILIPLLTIIGGITQIIAQGFNLLAFLPMSIIAIIIHNKNHLIKSKKLYLIILFGVIFSILGSCCANLIDKGILKIIFGSFLILLSFFEFYKIFKK